ncbi:surface glycoprotein [Halarchaeum sp. P4]|uniref:surface glycoprotein n=1 Tax=Halarchaeum sp. P4 TaxID=3421639 RepID=UPI003EC120B6
MTDASRALALSALLVASVVAGTAAFAGGAAAAGTATGSVSASPSTAGETATHTANATVGSDLNSSSLTGFKVDYAANTSATDVSNVNESDVQNVSIVRENGTWVNVRDDLSSVNTENNGHTVTFGFGGSYSLYRNDTVHVEYGDVQNPSSAGTYEVALSLNPQSAGATNVTYNVTPAVQALNVSVSPATDGTLANHTVVASPGEETANTSLSNVTVAYGWAVDSVQWGSTPSAFVDADGDAQYDADERALNATALTVSDGTVTVEFDGNYTLESGTDVVLRYVASNPETTGEFGVDARFNGGPTASDTVTITDGKDWGSAHVHAQPPTSGVNSTHLVHVHQLDAADVGDSLNKLEVDYAVGSAPADVSNVDQNDVERVGILRNGSFINVSDDLSSVSASNDGETLLFGFGGSYSLQQGDELLVAFDDVQNPAVNATTATNVAVGVNVQSSDSPAYARFHVTNDTLAATVVGEPADASSNATQGVVVYPGTAQDGETLSEMTVTYDGTQYAFDGDLSNVTASDVFRAAVYDRATGTQTATLDVTGVSGDGDSVTVTFAGSYTLSPGDVVAVGYADVTAPTTAGIYWANVTVNGAATNYTDSRVYVAPNTSLTDASLAATETSPNATTNHTVSATVAPGDAADVLAELEVEYGNDTSLANASVATLAIDRGGDGSVDATIAPGQYDAVVEDGEVDVRLTSDTRVSSSDRVVLTLAGVQNPSSGESSATVEVNDAEARASVAVSTQSSDTDTNTGGGGWGGGVSDTDDDTANTGDSSSDTTTTTSTTTTTQTETSTAESPDETGDATTTTTTSTSTQTTTTTGSSAGFGALVALLAAGAAALLARRD